MIQLFENTFFENWIQFILCSRSQPSDAITEITEL